MHHRIHQKTKCQSNHTHSQKYTHLLWSTITSQKNTQNIRKSLICISYTLPNIIRAIANCHHKFIKRIYRTIKTNWYSYQCSKHQRTIPLMEPILAHQFHRTRNLSRNKTFITRATLSLIMSAKIRIVYYLFWYKRIIPKKIA